jgi:hypothetical protein
LVGRSGAFVRAIALVSLCAVIGLALPAPNAVTATSPDVTGAFLYGDSASGFLMNDFRSLDPTGYRFVQEYPAPDKVDLRIFSSQPGYDWNLVFAAPPGESLTTGTYSNARTYFVRRSPGVPGFLIGGEGQGCSEHQANFTVDELERDDAGNVTKFAASYVHKCADSSHTGFDRGVVRFHSSLTWKGWRATPDHYGFEWRSQVVGTTSGRDNITLENVGLETINVGAAITGSNPGEFVLDDPDACLGELAPGDVCQFGVRFRPTAKAARSAKLVVSSDVFGTSRSIELVGTGVHVSPALTITADPKSALVGETVTFTVTADPEPDGGDIYLFYGDSSNRISNEIGHKPVGGANGNVVTFTKAFAQNEGLQLMATFSGTSNFDYSESPIFARSQQGAPETWFDEFPGTWSQFPVGHFAWHYLGGGFYTPAVSYQCSLDGADWATCATPYDTPSLPDGLHQLSVRGIDAQGHIEPQPESVSWHIDTSGPTFTFTINSGASLTNNSTVQLDINALDQSGTYNMRIALWDELDQDGLLDGNGDRQFSVNPTASLTRDLIGGTPEDGQKTVYLQLADLLGNWSTIGSKSIVLDTHAPDTLPPTVSIRTGHMGSTIPVSLSWPTPVDAISGLATRSRYRAIDGGPWVSFPRPASASLSSDTLNPGSTYLYSQRSIDKAGNGTTWIEGPSFRAAVRQEGNTQVGVSGTWKKTSLAGALGGKVLRSTAAGATVSTTFTGNSIGWLATKGPRFGLARVYVDGIAVATVDLHAASRTARQVVWSTTFPTMGTHTVSVVNLGSAGHSAVDMDAFLLLVAP